MRPLPSRTIVVMGKMYCTVHVSRMHYSVDYQDLGCGIGSAAL